MYKFIMIIFIISITTLSFLTSSCAGPRPPKPGQDFVWVKAHKTPAGVHVPGHWKHTGTSPKGKTWVPGHNNADGVWVRGHWKKAPLPKKSGVWVPGHHGPGGRWVPGHWRK